MPVAAALIAAVVSLGVLTPSRSSDFVSSRRPRAEPPIRTILRCFSLALLALALPSSAVVSERDATTKPSGSTPEAAATEESPPSGAGVEVVVLLPEDHAAFTTQPQPTLYWYPGAATDAEIEVIVNRDQDEEPLVERQPSGSFDAGIHALSIWNLDIGLETDTVYRWYFQVSPDGARPSQKSFSGGSIERITASAAPTTNLESSTRSVSEEREEVQAPSPRCREPMARWLR